MDGSQVLITIRSSPTPAEIAIVVLTASAMEVDVNQTMALGIDAYVVKPMEIQRFVSIMCDLASRFTKAGMGATHSLTKTLDQVRTEMSLLVLAYNFKRL